MSSLWATPNQSAIDGMDTEMLQVCDNSSDDEDEIDRIKHRKSLMNMEHNLMEPCDQTPIAPASLRLENSFAESGGPTSLERLLMERLLLRKELRLRKMQEHILQQEDRIQELEARLAEVEDLSGYRCFLAIGRSLNKAVSASERGYHIVRIGLNYILSALYQALFVCFLTYIPTSLSLSGAAMIQRAGSIMAQRAENFSNERVERLEWEKEKERSDRPHREYSDSSHNNHTTTHNNSRRRRRIMRF